MSAISTTTPTNAPITTDDESIGDYMYVFFYSLIVLIWVVSGLIGFVVSIVCLFYESSVSEKIIGVLLGVFTGPFFWLYYIYNINYCNLKLPTSY